MRILHVENDPITVRQVELILQDVAGECETTALGEHAVQLAAQKTYDLILLDVMLPDIDGCEVIERLRSAGVDTPYLIISGLVDRESDFGDRAFGIGDYLAKPFTRDELISRVTAVIARSKLAKLPILEEPLPEAPQRAAVERRRHRRFEIIKSAKIDHGDGICCKILNMSHGGAAIRVTDDQLDLPTTFSLELAGGTTHVCRIIWRESDKIGVKFLDRS